MESQDDNQTPIVIVQVVVNDDRCESLGQRQLHALRLLLAHHEERGKEHE